MLSNAGDAGVGALDSSVFGFVLRVDVLPRLVFALGVSLGLAAEPRDGISDARKFFIAMKTLPIAD